MIDRDDKVWLVKSSQRIIGPLTQNEIMRRLKSRELNLGDDASRPCRRWQTIQAHPDFRDLVDEVRHHVSDETQATFTPANVTQTLTDFSDGELTEELTDKMGNFTRTAEIVVHDLPEEKKTDAPTRGRFQAGGLAHNQALKKQADRTMRILWVVTSLVLIAALIFVIEKRAVKDSMLHPATVEAMRAEVPALIDIGDYSAALKILHNFFPDPLKSGEMGLYFAQLEILDGQVIVGRRILDNMLQTGIGDAKAEYTTMGVADLTENQLGAGEGNFQKALGIDKDYVPALINLAIVRFLQAQYSQAEAMAARAIQLNPIEGEAQLLLAETAIYSNEKSVSKESVDQALQDLAKYRAVRLDYEPEAAFYTLYLDWMKNGHKISEEKLNAFLDLDPELTEDHRHNRLIYQGQTKWNVIGRLCDQLVEQIIEHKHASTLRAVCLSKEGRKGDARTWIEKANDRSPNDALVQAWYSYILNENGRGDVASTELGYANNNDRKGEFDLPILLTGAI